MKLIRMILIAALCLVLLPVTAVRADSSEPGFTGNNINAQDYEIHSAPVKSNLVRFDSGYMIVHANSGSDIKAAYYDDNYVLQNTVSITDGLPLFGGFHAGTDGYYYIVTGQNNSDESADVECYRITRYDSSWNRIGSAGLYDCNTTIPFRAGSCRMADQNGYLMVHTCHQMYKNSDGLNHQANLSLMLDMSTIKIVDAEYKVANSYSFVSHSFNQFVLADDDYFVTVDHGDANPRAAVLSRYNTKNYPGKLPSNYTRISLMDFPGETGDNITDASIGGLEVSSTHYLTVGNSMNWDLQDNTFTRNIFVSAVNKQTMSNRTLYWLTEVVNYEKKLTTPHIIDLNNDTFMILWSEAGNSNDYGNPTNVYWTIVNNQGEPITETMVQKGILSDCVPVVNDNKVIWYTYWENKVFFNEIDLTDNTLSMKIARTKDWVEVQEIRMPINSAVLGLNQTVKIEAYVYPENASLAELYYLSDNPDIASVDKNGKITAKNLGETVIHVMTDNGVSNSLKIQVIEEQTGLYSYSYPDDTLRIGKSVKWDVRVVPSTLKVKFASDDPSVLSVDSEGNIHALSFGTATITAKAGLHQKSITITVIPNYIEFISIFEDEILMERGEIQKIGASIYPDDAETGEFTWYSENPEVAEVDSDGNVTAKMLGSTFVFVTEELSGEYSFVKISVVDHVHDYQFTEFIWADDYTTAIARFVCSKDASHVLELDANVDVNGSYAYAYVHFNGELISDTKSIKDDLAPQSITLNSSFVELETNHSFKLSATVSPSDALPYVLWSSSDESIAKVNSEGRVTALRYGKATITATSLHDSSVKATCTVQTRFYDVSDSSKYYYKPVYWAADSGITTGYDKVYFGPQQNCTRRELSIFLWRLAGKPAASGSLPFSDTGKYAKTTDSYKAILWCYTNGIVKGYSDGTFRPDNPIVRKDTMIMLYRLAGKPAVSGTLKFPDARALGYGPETDTYKSIVWGTQNGITNGYADGSFKPLVNCLREHIVTFVYRYDQKYN